MVKALTTNVLFNALMGWISYVNGTYIKHANNVNTRTSAASSQHFRISTVNHESACHRSFQTKPLASDTCHWDWKNVLIQWNQRSCTHVDGSDIFYGAIIVDHRPRIGSSAFLLSLFPVASRFESSSTSRGFDVAKNVAWNGQPIRVVPFRHGNAHFRHLEPMSRWNRDRVACARKRNGRDEEERSRIGGRGNGVS